MPDTQSSTGISTGFNVPNTASMLVKKRLCTAEAPFIIINKG